ncbi:hypothetical protein GQ600_21756 [Phytophthora cactorum]|nr:hypothetical protein GQ600_21756 [Phytophthora cactorum]
MREPICSTPDGAIVRGPVIACCTCSTSCCPNAERSHLRKCRNRAKVASLKLHARRPAITASHHERLILAWAATPWSRCEKNAASKLMSCTNIPWRFISYLFECMRHTSVDACVEGSDPAEGSWRKAEEETLGQLQTKTAQPPFCYF